MTTSSGQHTTSFGVASHYTRRDSNIFEMLLPPQAFILLILLLVLLPVTLLAGQSLFIPLFESLKSFVLPEMKGMQTILPWPFYLRLGIFLLLAFLGVFQLILRIRLAYYQAWAKGFSRPDPLHIDYQPDAQQSMLSVQSWNVYRLFAICLPPLIIGSIFVGTCFLELYLFNQFIDMPITTLPAVVISFLFISLLLMLFTVFSVGNSLWVLMITLFGDVVAITEPDLTVKVIYERCSRVAFSSAWVYLLYPAYFLFLIGVGAEIIGLVTTYDLQDLLQFKINFLLILALEGATLITYLGLNYLKFHAYHHALKRYYQRLPEAFRKHFVPPASLSLNENDLNSELT